MYEQFFGFEEIPFSITPDTSYFLNQQSIDTDTQESLKVRIQKIWDYHEESDKLIKAYAIDWTIDRINIVDLSILRLAFFEIRNTDIPKKVIVNEAIELSKEFGSEHSQKFINGILGKYVEEHV